MQAVKEKSPTLSVIIAAAGIVSAIIGVLTYRREQERLVMQRELNAIDKELKLLSLSDAKARAREKALDA